MVIPRLACHLDGNQQACYSGKNSQGGSIFCTFHSYLFNYHSHSHAYPDGKGIERTSIGIVTFTRLERRLVQIDHDGKSRHQEQQHNNQELLLTFTSLAPLP